MDVLNGGANLNKVLQDGLFRDEALLLLEISDQFGQIAAIGQLENNVKDVVVDV